MKKEILFGVALLLAFAFTINITSAEGELCCTDGTDQCGGSGYCDLGYDCVEDNSAWSQPDGMGQCEPDQGGSGEEANLCCTDGNTNCDSSATQCGEGLACIEDNSALSSPDGKGQCEPDPNADGDNNDNNGGNSCSAETNSEFCNRFGKDCGDFTENDNCGNQRTVNCGTCSTGTCGGDGVVNRCGISTIRTQFLSATFMDLRGEAITGADKGDRVKLYVQGTELLNKQVTFKVYKRNSWAGVDFLNPDTLLSPTSGITITSPLDTFATVNTTLNQNEIEAGNTIYFKVESESVSRTSEDLTIRTPNNAAPTPIISSPATGGIYFVGSNVQFSHGSYDIDSNIVSVLWNFGDGTTSSQTSTSHAYNTAGKKTVSLSITDEQGETSVQTRDIMIINGNGYTLFATISKPFHQEAVKSNNLAVNYDAGDSYVISSTTTGTSPCVTTIQCIQGRCPNVTAASMSCASNPNAPITITNGPQGYAQTTFNWTFKDSTSWLTPEVGLGKVSGTKGFSDYGPKNITLQVRYTAGSQNLQDTITRQFMLFNQRQCSTNGATWYRIDHRGNIIETISTHNTASCAGVDLQANTNDDCCPAGFACSTSPSNLGCQAESGNAQGCGSYTTQVACNADASQRVKSDVLWNYAPYNCGKSVNGKNYACSCAWTNGACIFNATNRRDDVSGTISSCTVSTQASACVDGYQSITLDAQDSGGNNPACVDSTQTLPCGRPVVALPFIGPLQIILVVILVAVIYTVLHNRPWKNRRR